MEDRRTSVKAHREAVTSSGHGSMRAKRINKVERTSAASDQGEVEIRVSEPQSPTPDLKRDKKHPTAAGKKHNSSRGSPRDKQENNDFKPTIRAVQFVDWGVIQENVCSKPECMVEVLPGEYNGASKHRHTGDTCKGHRFCIGERLEEKVPAREGLP